MYRAFRYVGPHKIARDAEGATGGIALRSRDDLTAAARSLGLRGPETVTYVVDRVGVLRVADRGSEHVACARGGPVLAAGELTLDPTERAITSATNLSTGFCPDTTCFVAFADALERAGIPGPAELEHAFEMRRCVRCGARQVVKDDLYECAECDAELPRKWNVDRARGERGWVSVEGTTWTIDTLVESGGRNEDRVGFSVRGAGVAIALADGAGGTGRGASAADRVVSTLASAFDDVAEKTCHRLDVELSKTGAETTAVLLTLDVGASLQVAGAAVGDSRALALRAGEWLDLTSETARKPLLGSGRARPTPFGAHAVDALLVGSDGLFNYANERALLEAVRASGIHAPWELADLARLPNGSLQDDLALVLVRREL